MVTKCNLWSWLEQWWTQAKEEPEMEGAARCMGKTAQSFLAQQFKWSINSDNLNWQSSIIYCSMGHGMLLRWRNLLDASKSSGQLQLNKSAPIWSWMLLGEKNHSWSNWLVVLYVMFPSMHWRRQWNSQALDKVTKHLNGDFAGCNTTQSLGRMPVVQSGQPLMCITLGPQYK